jgi:hypothetical protein
VAARGEGCSSGCWLVVTGGRGGRVSISGVRGIRTRPCRSCCGGGWSMEWSSEEMVRVRELDRSEKSLRCSEGGCEEEGERGRGHF